MDLAMGGILGWIILGGLAGWIASMIKSANTGLLMNIVLGIIGGLLGGFLLGLFGFEQANMFWSFITAIIGAVILIAIVRAIRK